MYYISKYFTGVATAIAVTMGLAGCVGDSYNCPGDEPDPVERPTGVSIRFEIISSQNNRSRAADIDGDVQGSAPEDYIETRSMQFLLFDSNQRFLQNLTPVVTQESQSGLYTAHATFREPYFEQAQGSDVTFYIMALANGTYMGGAWAGAVRGSTTIEQLCNATQNTVLTAKPIPSHLMYANILPDTQKFPMAGLQHFTVTTDALKASSYDAPVELSEGAGGRTLNMLRALAKIEVVDKANYTGIYDDDAIGNEACRIDKAEIVGFFSCGNQLPLYSQWMRGDVTLPETQQVVAPSIPSGCTYLNPPAFSSNNDDIASSINGQMIIDMVYDSYATEARADKAPVNSVYIYEFSNPASGINITQNPFIRITTKGESGTSYSQVLPFRLGTYSDDGIFQTELNEILRNHIYRYEITKINLDGTYSANWVVCPMSEVNITIPPFN